MALQPLSGHVFCFISKRRHQIKILFWDRTGFVLITKRIERGCFRFPREIAPGATHLDLESPELTLILEGIDLQRSRRRARWTPPTDIDSR
jgi:transposase